MSLDLSGKAIEMRVREASRMAGALSPDSRLSTKIDMSGHAVEARLRQASELLELCRKLGEGRRPR